MFIIGHSTLIFDVFNAHLENFLVDVHLHNLKDGLQLGDRMDFNFCLSIVNT